ncbi:MAG: hypothetical protein O3A02_03320, partial [bacterium]|nr:hypothetical protein [bacterium]
DIDAGPTVGGDARFGAYPLEPRWTPGSNALVIAVNRAGRTHLARVDLDTAPAWTPLGDGDRVMTAFDGDDAWALQVVETPTTPGELVLRAPDGAETRLSELNDR